MSRINDLIEKMCPNGVNKYIIEDICKVTRGRIISKNELAEKIGEYPVYSSQTLNNGVFGKINTYDYEGEYVQWTTDGANAGSIFYRNGKFSVTNVCGLLKIKEKYLKLIRTDYLAYTLSMESKKYVNYSTSNPKLMSNVMSKITVLIPPIEVQEEIVKILDKFSELEAELEAELKQRKRQYDYYKMQCFEKIKDVKYKHITDIASVKARVGWQRLTKAEYLQKGDYYLITGTDFQTDGNINFESCVYVTEARYNMDENIQIHKNDILITKDGTLGKVAIIEEEPNKPTTLNSGVFRIHITAKYILPKYIYHYFTSKYFSDFVESVKTGSTIPHLTQQGLVTLNIPIPTIEEQKRIVNILDKFDRLVNNVSEGLPAEIELRKQQYEYYKDRLLSFKEVTA